MKQALSLLSTSQFILPLTLVACVDIDAPPSCSSASLQHSISLVWPQLEKQRTLKRNFLLLEGLVVSRRATPSSGIDGCTGPFETNKLSNQRHGTAASKAPCRYLCASLPVRWTPL